jgi:hypothetical protein
METHVTDLELQSVSGGLNEIIVTGSPPGNIFGGGAGGGGGGSGNETGNSPDVQLAPDGGGGGFGGLPPLTTIPDAQEGACPPNITCTPVEGANDMFVRGSDGKIYLSPTGVERAQSGADIDWWGVAVDLAIIVGGGLAGVGASVIGVIGALLGIAGATLAELLDIDITN